MINNSFCLLRVYCMHSKIDNQTNRPTERVYNIVLKCQ